MNFQQFLKEDKTNKNVHLEHLEDLVFMDGITGVKNSIMFLRSLRDMLSGHSEVSTDVTTKWDGAPAIICGINPENKKFFVGTKSVFGKTNPKINYTEKDIDTNYPESGLNKKLKVALRYLPLIGIKNIIQGDMLFTKGDIKRKKIDGENYIVFQPNTITYAVPEDSALADQLLAAEIGVVFHTTYVGKTIADAKASFGVDIGNMKHVRQVWFRDASFTDASGTATFTEEETNEINEILSEAAQQYQKLNPTVISRILNNDTIKIYITAFNNQKVREGQEITNTAAHTKALIQSVTMRLNRDIEDAKKEDTRKNREKIKKEVLGFFNQNFNALVDIFDMMNILVRAKNKIVRKLEQVREIGTFLKTEDGYKVTAPEGFVAIDRLSGRAVKFVDRLVFSRNNFNIQKDWSK